MPSKMDDELMIVTTNAIVILLLAGAIAHERKRRRWWVREVFTYRDVHGFNASLIPRLAANDVDYYRDFMRMTPETFNQLFAMVGPLITKQDTRWRNAIPAKHRLALTLRFLATGDSLRSLSFGFLMGRTTCSKIIADVCEAIWIALSPTYLKFPATSEEWVKIAERFNLLWQFPTCLGALDGKHVVVQCPPKTGSVNYNFKGDFSKVLMALVDADYKFIGVDIGNYGSESDGGIFRRSNLGKGMLENEFDFPAPAKLPHFSYPAHYAVVADEAFPLLLNLLRPYPGPNFNYKQKVFNYRLSRARRIVENAFGILSARWRIFRKPITASEDNVDLIVKATVCLHNYLMTGTRSKHSYCPLGLTDIEDERGVVTLGRWRAEDGNGCYEELGKSGTNTYSRMVGQNRDRLAEYFAGQGAVPWQDNHIN